MTMKSTICQGFAFSEALHLTIVIIVPVFGKLKSPCFLFRIIISGHNDIVVTIVTTRDWDQGLELDPDIPHGVESDGVYWRVIIVRMSHERRSLKRNLETFVTHDT